MKFYIISDCHGNIEGLWRALEKKEIVDNHGRLLSSKHQVISIGDLANCVENSWIGDIACLDLVGEVIDTMLIGNHEMPYLDSENSFGGFKWIPEIHHKIQTLLSEDLIGPAIIVGNTLISHAGVSKHFVSIDEQNNSEHWFNLAELNWNARNWEHFLFSSCGRKRGGRDKVGGMIWCDFDNEFVPTKFPQIVGHTPKFVRMKDNALCIDVGAKNQETEPFILELA